MQKFYHTLFLFFLLNTSLFSQNITSTIRGTVQDALTKEPLLGATIKVFNIESSMGGTTDESGNFKIKNIPVGRYEVEISYLGYETLLLTETLLESGKETVLAINLQESTADLQQVVVKSTTQNTNISPLSNHEITIEEVERFPATFFDPARLAMLYPGVTGTNDQANGLSIRGLPPSLMQWRLEGVEIVNPNHLSNAGTISDQPSVAAGGVNILSAQMLDNSRLFTGAFPVEYSNALGGVMDMRLRKGNNEQHEFTAQAGLLGFDLGMEGPFSQKSKASFLFNYRYSFTGLLTNFGVDFDGEEIGFEDVSFHLNLPTENAGNFTVFGIGGRSDNFRAALPEEEWEEFMDMRDVTYQSTNGVLGLTHEIAIGRNTFWKTALVYSRADTEYILNFGEDSVFNIMAKDKKISGQTQVVSAINQFFNIKGGLNIQRTMAIDSLEQFPRPHHQTITTEITPFVDFQFLIGQRLKFNIGLNANVLKVKREFLLDDFLSGLTIVETKKGDDFSLDPRSTLVWTINKKHQLSAFAGFYSKILNLENFNQIIINSENKEANFEFTKAFQQSLKYQNNSIPKTTLSFELFHQTIKHIPSFGFNSLINLDENSFYLGNSGISSYNSSSKNYGIELMVQRSFYQSWYFLVSGTLYDSQYKADVTFNSEYEIARYNGNWAANITVGKEFIKQKLNKTRTFGIHLRGIHRGGFWEKEREIDEHGDLNVSDFYNEQLPNYFRIDLRFSLKWNKTGKTSALTLDLQNATNHQNVAYNYLDSFGEREIKTQYQLGLIPLLNYRIEF